MAGAHYNFLTNIRIYGFPQYLLHQFSYATFDTLFGQFR